MLIEKMVDGIIFISSGDSAHNIKKLQSNNIPVVFADRDVQDQPVDTVMVNNQQGGKLATEHLIQLGHRRIACISGPVGIRVSIQRMHAFHNTMKEHGMSVPVAYCTEGDFGFESGERCMRQMLARGARPTAVFVGNDMMALAPSAPLDAGMHVPDDISIIGFDDIPLAKRIHCHHYHCPADRTSKIFRRSACETHQQKNVHNMPEDYQRVVLDKIGERKS